MKKKTSAEDSYCFIKKNNGISDSSFENVPIAQMVMAHLYDVMFTINASFLKRFISLDFIHDWRFNIVTTSSNSLPQNGQSLIRNFVSMR